MTRALMSQEWSLLGYPSSGINLTLDLEPCFTTEPRSFVFYSLMPCVPPPTSRALVT